MSAQAVHLIRCKIYAVHAYTPGTLGANCSCFGRLSFAHLAHIIHSSQSCLERARLKLLDTYSVPSSFSSGSESLGCYDAL